MDCLNCNKPLSGKQQKFCSTRCNNAYNMRRYKGYKNRMDPTKYDVCQNCGKSLSVRQKKWCSAGCQAAAWMRATRKKNAKTVKIREPKQLYFVLRSRPKPCEYCGKETNRRHYCSDECWHKARRVKGNRAKREYESRGGGFKKERDQHRRNPTDFTPADWQKALEFYEYKCAYCGSQPKQLEQDHVVPMRRGGRYEKANIVPACKSCNSSKRATPLVAWLFSKNRLSAFIKYLDYLVYLGYFQSFETACQELFGSRVTS